MLPSFLPQQQGGRKSAIAYPFVKGETTLEGWLITHHDVGLKVRAHKGVGNMEKGVLMKNFAKFLGIIALVAVIGFSMTACGGDDNGGGGGSKYTQAQYYAYGRIVLGQAPSGGQSDNFEVNLGQSTLPDFTTSGNPRTTSESCGFSVTVGSATKEIYGLELSSMYEDYNIVLNIDNTGITASDTITIKYTPDGTHVFKNRGGKALEAFTITARYNAN